MFRTGKASRILLKLAPPVMLAQLIQALYNLVDSFFVGRYSESGLTVLSIIYPVQLLMIAFAVGTGVGINTMMAANLGLGREKRANEFAGVGTPLAGALWLIFALICWLILPAYARMSTTSEEVIADVVQYGRIVCVLSVGLFLESVWTKILQAGGDMKTPMLAQIFGAITNIVLDPILIFGWLGLPELGDPRRCHSHGGRAVRGCGGGVQKGISANSAGQDLPAQLRQHFPLRHPQYPHAVGIYILHLGPEPDSGGLFRRGGHGLGPVL